MGIFKGVAPNFLLLWLVYVALYQGRFSALFIGFLGGLFLDCFNPAMFGVNMLIFTVIAYVFGALSDYLYKESPLAYAIGVFGASLLYGLLFLIFETPGFALGIKLFFLNVLPSSLLNLAIAGVLIGLRFLFLRS